MTRVPKPEALTAQEAAVLLNAHVETIRRLARQGEIPSFKLGKDWRFHEAALRSWADAASRTPSSSPRGPQATAHQVDDLLAAADRSTDDSFPIVGIGASAGGLEALELFLRMCRRTAASPSSSSSTWTRRAKASCPSCSSAPPA